MSKPSYFSGWLQASKSGCRPVRNLPAHCSSANTILIGMVPLKLQCWTRWWDKQTCTGAPLAMSPLTTSSGPELQSPPFLHTPLPTHSHQIPKASILRENTQVPTSHWCWSFRTTYNPAALRQAPRLPDSFSSSPFPRAFPCFSPLSVFCFPPLPSIQLLCERGRDRVHMCGPLAASGNADCPEEYFLGLKQHGFWKDILQGERYDNRSEQLGFWESALLFIPHPKQSPLWTYSSEEEI